MVNKVQCLECDETFDEDSEKDLIEVCPHCGNDNVGLTVYLTDNAEEQ